MSAKRRRSKTAAHPPAEKAVVQDSDQWFSRLLVTSSFLLGLLLVWCFCLPCDAVSVFQGQALAQNLLWLALAALVAGTAALRGGFEFGRWPVWICVLCLCWMIGSTLAAGRENNPRVAWNGFWQVMAFAGCYFTVLGLSFGPRTKGVLLGALVAGCVAMSCQGLYQLAVIFPEQKAAYLQDPDATLEAAEINAPPGSPQRQRYEDRLNSPEPYGSFALANSLGALLSMGLIVCGGAAWLHRRQLFAKPRKTSPLLFLSVAVVAFVLVAVVWLLTRSRTAYLATVLGSGFLVLDFLTRRRHGNDHTEQTEDRPASTAATSWWPWLGPALIGLLLVVGFGFLLRSDRLVLSESMKSVAFRLEYWVATADMIADHPWQGVGLGNFRNYYTSYKLPTASEEIADPHNWILDTAATLSVPICLVLVVWLSRVLLSPRKKETPPSLVDQHIARWLAWGFTFGALLCGLFLVGMLRYDAETFAVGWIPGLVVLLGVAIAMGGEEPLLQEPQIEWLAKGGLATLLVCLLASGSWQASGLGVPVVVLAAISQGSRRLTAPGQSPRDATGLPMHRWAIVLPVVGFLAFVMQAWRPVSVAWMHGIQAEVAVDSDEREQELRLAISADPLDTSYQQKWLEVKYQQAIDCPQEEFYAAAKECLMQLDQWLPRDRWAFPNWHMAGQFAGDFAARAERLSVEEPRWQIIREEFSRQAEAYFGQAVARYPSSVELQMQLAFAAALNGNREPYEQHLKAAIEQSEATPHLDKKLEAQLVRVASPKVPETLKNNFGQVKAELLVDWLRSNESILFSAGYTER